MNNKELIELYKMGKFGTKNTTTKRCLCGTEMDINEKECPRCRSAVPKSKMINVNRNTAIAKRFVKTITGDTYTFMYYQLLSNGLDLYETESLKFEINKSSGNVIISNDKVFKSQDKNQELYDFIEKNYPGFLEYVNIILMQHRNEYAVTKFTSLTASAIENVLAIYLNYHALEEYLMPYKVLYYGKKVNLKKYYPGIDFNDSDSVKETGLNLDFLKVWDIKNEKYIEKIIELSSEPKLIQTIITDSIEQMFDQAQKDYSFDYNKIIDSYGILYNREISTEDFIRIYQSSRNASFCLMKEYRTLYKKYYKKNILWSEVKRVSFKEVQQLSLKIELMKKGLNKEQIEKLYELLEQKPVKAMEYMQGLDTI